MPKRYTLKSARLLAGLTAEQVAFTLGMNVNTIYSYENKKSYPRVDTAKEMAELYGIKFSELNFF